MYTTIPIDFDVYKKLTSLLTDDADTYNSVLRRVLELPLLAKTKEPAKLNGIPWVSRGITLPHGTELRAPHKGKLYEGKVDNGSLVANGDRFKFSISCSSFDHWHLRKWVDLLAVPSARQQHLANS